MKLKIDPGEMAGIEFTTRPHCSGAIRVYDEHGRILMMLVMSSDANKIRLVCETPWCAQGPLDEQWVIEMPHPQEK